MKEAMVTMTNLLNDIYVEINEKINSIYKSINTLNGFVTDVTIDQSKVQDFQSQEAMRIILTDALLQVDAFYIEQALRQLEGKQEQGITVDEYYFKIGHKAIMAADDTRCSLRECGYIAENEDFENPDPQALTEAINAIQTDFMKEYKELHEKYGG